MLQALWNGLVQGALYAVVALGYTMVYGILMLINFAHGEVVMVGAYTGMITLAGFAGNGTIASIGIVPSLLAATLAAMLVCTLYGVTIERQAYRPLRSAPPLSPLISAIGVSMLLQNFVMAVQGNAEIYGPTTDPDYVGAVGGSGWHSDGLGLTVTPIDLILLVTCLALMSGLWLFVQKTRIGKAMRATSQDRVMAGMVGIGVDKVVATTFAIGSALGAVAGVLLAIYNSGQAMFTMGFTAGTKAFTAAVLGGIGNIPGAMLGGFLLGVVEMLGRTQISDQYKDVYAFVILLLVLVVRPRGILGERVAEKV